MIKHIERTEEVTYPMLLPISHFFMKFYMQFLQSFQVNLIIKKTGLSIYDKKQRRLTGLKNFLQYQLL